MEIIFKGVPVHYEIIGEGKPLIFLHGFNENSQIWHLVLPNISSHYQCICIDLPGFGKSGLPSSLSLKYMADAVHRVISELNIVKPIIIGHSLGGYICLELAHYYPDLMSGVGLFHSTAIEDTDEKKNNRLKTLEFLDKNPINSFFNMFIPGLFAPHQLNTELYNSTELLIKTTKKESVIAGIKSMLERVGRTETLKNINIPWLFIAGRYDQFFSIETISLQASYCNKSMFEILEDSGHIGMLEEPIKSSEIIVNFAKWVF